MGKYKPPRLSETRRPRNDAEGKCHDYLKENGFLVCRRGWPDFIIQKDDEVAFVEVKPDGYRGLKTEQRFMMNFFADHGIACYRFTPRRGFEKIR